MVVVSAEEEEAAPAKKGVAAREVGVPIKKGGDVVGERGAATGLRGRNGAIRRGRIHTGRRRRACGLRGVGRTDR